MERGEHFKENIQTETFGMEMASGEGKLVCVTGASGYIASWLTKLLLQRGYTVRATVRNLNDVKKTEHLLALDGAKERLHLFEADLLKDGSFDSVVDGCEGVFHTASPCFTECQDPQTELIDPAVKGTINILSSCAKSSCKRVVLTCSTYSILFDRRSQTPGTIADETWFSDPELCIESKQWYALSKTLAEKAAWKFVKEKGIDMVTVHPGLTLGPLLQPTLNFSSSLIAGLINAKVCPNASTSWVHVKDVVNAHILAFETPSASGRYPLVERSVRFSKIVSIIREIYPTLHLPDECVDGVLPDAVPVSREKMKSLDMDSCIPLEMGLEETIKSLKKKKFIAF